MTEIIVITDQMVRDALNAAVAALTPEAKRDLAAHLLRSASTDEGYSEDAA
jgi:hypothetical protein